MVDRDVLVQLGGTMQPHLDERQWRLFSGAIARLLGRGGVSAVASAWSMSRNTVIDGKQDVESGAEVTERIRRPGAGRKRREDTDPEIDPRCFGLARRTDRTRRPDVCVAVDDEVVADSV